MLRSYWRWQDYFRQLQMPPSTWPRAVALTYLHHLDIAKKTVQLVWVTFSSYFCISLWFVTLYGCASVCPLLYQTDRGLFNTHSTNSEWLKEHKEGLRWWVGLSGGGQREKCQRGDKDNTIWLQMIVSVISMGLGLHRNLSRAFLLWHRQSFYWANDEVEVELPLLLVPMTTLYF